MQILGRAKDISDFIKHGAESGYVEIELKGKGSKNTVLRRDLHKDNKSDWKLNGNARMHTPPDTQHTPTRTHPPYLLALFCVTIT